MRWCYRCSVVSSLGSGGVVLAVYSLGSSGVVMVLAVCSLGSGGGAGGV